VKIKNAGCMPKEYIYLAFKPKTPKSTIEKYDEFVSKSTSQVLLKKLKRKYLQRK
jgi:hypothetical protein